MADHNQDYELSLPSEGSLDEAIEAFKGILEVFPEDMGARESLFAACVQAGYQDQALDHGVKLAEIYSEQNEWKKVRNITRKLLDLGVDDERVDVLHQTAEDTVGTEEPSEDIGEAEAAEKPSPPQKKEKKKQAPATLKRDLSGELDLAWMLLQNEVITEDQYEKAISALSENHSSANSRASICLLHELAGIDRVHMDKVLGFLSAETNIPYIEVDRFDLDSEITDLVPLDDIRRYGVLPFGEIKDELMVAILNPVNEQLQTQARRYFDRPIHFFICSPDAMQKIIDEIESQKKAAG